MSGQTARALETLLNNLADRTESPLPTVTSAPRLAPHSVETVLGRAARRLYAEASPALADAAPVVDEVLPELVQAVERVARGEPVEVASIGSAVAARRMLDRLQHFVLDDDGPASESSALRALRAIERVRRVIDEDAEVRALNQMEGDDALQLLVEVAHDMRSPLNAVLFLTDHLRSKGNLTALQSKQLGVVHGAAFGLSALANDLVELARGGGSLFDRKPIAFSVGGVVESVRGIVQPMVEQKGIQLTTTTLQADTRVGHPVALARVLLNLVTNAVKFTPAGTVAVTCEATTRRTVRFTVTDTGRGIPAELMPVILEPLRKRAGQRGVGFSTAGLGLSICRSLVAKMGGTLTVDSVVGQRTTFAFELDLPVSSPMNDIGW